MATTETIGIVAGGGRFPLHVAQAAKRQGVRVVGIGLQGWVDPGLAERVDIYEELPVGQLGRIRERLNAHHVTQATLAGKVTKEALWDPRAAFDGDALRILQHAREGTVPQLVEAIGRYLGSFGITLVDSSHWLRSSLCPEGSLTSRGPTADEWRDVEAGLGAARTLAALDIGQTVVVKRGIVVAVEALEGTDATIQRAHALAGEGLVVVKVASPHQDRRMDLPVVGTQTLSTLRDTGVTCLAVEAHVTVLLDREDVIASANEAGLCLIGVALQTP